MSGADAAAAAADVLPDVHVVFEQNRRYRRTMEDTHVILQKLVHDTDHTSALLCVFDGHGGTRAAEMCRDDYPDILREAYSSHSDYPRALLESYDKMDAKLLENDVQDCGCTSVTAVITREPTRRRLFVANAGDSRAVLCRRGRAVRLTYDHKASDPAEIKRIQSGGGFVVHGRVNGILSVSRSFGDHICKDAVISKPHMCSLELSGDDTFLILACDGVWDVITDQEAVDLLAHLPTAKAMAETLLRTSLKKFTQDNLSVIVAKFV